jgi:hypothetical protein
MFHFTMGVAVASCLLIGLKLLTPPDTLTLEALRSELNNETQARHIFSDMAIGCYEHLAKKQ